MAATDEMLEIAKKILPDYVTLVPEKREEVTTEGGLNVKSNVKYLKNFVANLKDLNIEVSAFIDPLGEQINYSKETCLLYTSPSPRDKRQSRMPSSA